MKKKLGITISLILIFLMLLSSVSTYAAGKRVIAENKYIWIYVNGYRELVAEDLGYPCFGQGLDNKNVLYVPLKVICNMVDYNVSSLKKMQNPDKNAEEEFIFYVTVSNKTKAFNVCLDTNTFDTVKMAGNAFVLKGTEALKNPVVMVPLGVAKDYFGLDLEVKRPVGRGVYDYCSLAINFSHKDLDNNMRGLISVPTPEGNADAIDKNANLENQYYVSSLNNFYHSYNCDLISKEYNSLSEYECIYWGYEKCSECLNEETQQH